MRIIYKLFEALGGTEIPLTKSNTQIPGLYTYYGLISYKDMNSIGKVYVFDNGEKMIRFKNSYNSITFKDCSIFIKEQDLSQSLGKCIESECLSKVDQVIEDETKIDDALYNLAVKQHILRTASFTWLAFPLILLAILFSITCILFSKTGIDTGNIIFALLEIVFLIYISIYSIYRSVFVYSKKKSRFL